jgi:hypothetical protein
MSNDRDIREQMNQYFVVVGVFSFIDRIFCGFKEAAIIIRL